jgi:hypothetical protein
MKILILSFFLVLCSLLYSQGNLQFNQVKLVSTIETVPAGKVWKVEGATFAGGSVFCVGGPPGPGNTYCGNQILQSYGFIGVMSFDINGQSNHISHLGYSSSSSTQLSPFPFWLPAGSTLAASTNMRYLSVLEFNIIP